MHYMDFQFGDSIYPVVGTTDISHMQLINTTLLKILPAVEMLHNPEHAFPLLSVIISLFRAHGDMPYFNTNDLNRVEIFVMTSCDLPQPANDCLHGKHISCQLS